MDEDLDELVARQAGLVVRRQLVDHGVTWERVRNQLAAQRWKSLTPRVVATTTGELTRDQREWMAVLHAGPRSMLGGLTAAARQGLSGWDREVVTVWVDDELSFEPVDGVRFFRSRRSLELLRHPQRSVPTARVEPAVLLHAAYAASTPRVAHGLLAAAVQQQLTTAARLTEWVDRLRPLRGAKDFRATLSDIEGGSQSGAELDVLRLCRRHGLPEPSRQTGRTDSAGRRRWTDCEWVLPTGETLVLEIDGGFHMDVRSWTADKQRGRRLSGGRRIMVGCTTYELRHEPDELVADLRALGLGESCA